MVKRTNKMRMNKKQEFIKYGNKVGLLIYIPVYGIGYLLAKRGSQYISGILLITLAIVLYAMMVYCTKNPVNLKGLFSLSWIGGQGLACFQLSKLQQDWSNTTWLCFFFIYVCFSLGYNIQLGANKQGKGQDIPWEFPSNERQAGRVLICCAVLAGLSIACFLLEALVVGYVPLFSKLPHAYSYFHISGVHYFTISCILIPGLSVVYHKIAQDKSRLALTILLVCNVTAFAIPILCVSRFQLIFAIGFALVVYIAVYQKIRLRAIVILVLIMIPLYALMTLARNHDVAYLNSVFEMKNSTMPIFITQPYMYVVNNYENFNCMVEQLAKHSYGLRMLFPVFALTGLKFVFPQLISFPMYITKNELTTLTMFYDAYYDFGIIGIIIFAFVLGYVARKIASQVVRGRNPIIFVIYGQIAVYLALAFFTTWFSNPTTWFWLALTVFMYWFVGYEKKEDRCAYGQ